MDFLLKTTLSALCCSAVALAGPVHKSAPSSIEARWQCPSGNQTQKIWEPATWNIYPHQRNLSSGPVSHFEVQSSRNESQLEQVVIFSGIPQDAKRCTLGWSQGDAATRRFLVDGESGLVHVRPLSGLPSKGNPITYDSIMSFDGDTDKGQLSPDFTFWDGIDEATDHVAGVVDCAEEMAFKMSIADPTVDSHVYLGSDKRNGFWFEYSC